MIFDPWCRSRPDYIRYIVHFKSWSMSYPLPPEARAKLLRVRIHWVKSEAGVERFTIAVRAHP